MRYVSMPGKERLITETDSILHFG